MMLVIVLLFCVIILPVLANMFAGYEVLTILMVVLLPCACYASIVRMRGNISVTCTDVLVLLLLAYGCFSAGIIRHFQIDGLIYYEWVLLLIVYWIARMLDRRYWLLLLCGVVLAGGIQSIICILQYSEILVASNDDFRICGSFHNPGPLGGFLSVSFVGAVCLLVLKENRIWKMSSVFLLLLIGNALIVSNSRAAWLAVLVTLPYLFYQFYPVTMCRISKKWTVKILFLTLFMGISMGLYHYKRASADVRLLIWTVSAKMFADAPLCGHGVASFPMKYMGYQAGYFKQHPNTTYLALSDNNTQAFNEPLAIACEQGIVGLLLVLSVVASAFLSGGGLGWMPCLLLPLCVFSCFSYPGDILALKVLFPLLLGFSTGRSLWEIGVRKKFAFVFWGLVLPLTVWGSIHITRSYGMAFTRLNGCVSQAELPYNRKYMSNYAKLLFEERNYENFLHSVTEASFPFMTSVIKCDIGMAYMQLGKIEEAEKTLMCAYWMVPSKVLPKYYLFLLYRNNNCDDRARKMAEEIVSLKMNQVGSVYLEARSEARIFLKERERTISHNP